MNGWVLLHKKIWSSEVTSSPYSLSVWIWLLTHADESGVVTCGRNQIAKETHIKPETVRYWLSNFSKKFYTISTIKTTNQFSQYQICKWEEYQRKTTKPSTSKLPLIKNKEIPIIEKIEHKTYFKQPKSRAKGKKGSGHIIAQAKEVAVIFQEARGGHYTNTLHLEATVGLLENHGFDRVVEIAEYGLSLPKSNFNPWIDKPIDLADHWARLIELKEGKENVRSAFAI